MINTVSEVFAKTSACVGDVAPHVKNTTTSMKGPIIHG